MALVAVVSCVRKTHTGCISVFFDTLHEPEAITTLLPMPGQATLWGESGCSPGRHCPGRGLLRLPLHRRAAGRGCCVSVIAGPGVTCKLARHMTAASVLRYFRSMPQVVRRGLTQNGEVCSADASAV